MTSLNSWSLSRISLPFRLRGRFSDGTTVAPRIPKHYLQRDRDNRLGESDNGEKRLELALTRLSSLESSVQSLGNVKMKFV